MVDGGRLERGAGRAFLRLLAVRHLWNYPRVKCTLCGATKGIAYQEIAGGLATVKAETCESCRGYVKILHQHKDPSLDPIADDVATVALDMLLRDLGYRRGAVDPFLLGY